MIGLLSGNLWRPGCILLAVIVSGLLIHINGLPILGGGLMARIDKLQFLRVAEVNSHRKTKENYKIAAAKATAEQIAANLKPAQDSAIIARISDATAPSYYDAVRRYADSVRPGKAAQCSGSTADMPRADSPVQSADDAADPAGWVSVARSDWSLVTAAAGQSYLCARDGQALIAAGAAVAARDEGND